MQIDRRGLILSLISGFSIACQFCGQAAVAFPKRERRHSSDSDIGGASLTEGCASTEDGVVFFGAAGDNSNRPGVFASSGNPFWDHALGQEVNRSLKPIFGLNPDFCYFDDSTGGNAFATPERLIGNGQGTVALGMRLFNELIGKFLGSSSISIGDHAAVAVLAHEFGHVAQFNIGLPELPVQPRELHADYLSGWYMATRARQLMGFQQVNVMEAAQEMFDIGSFDFTNPSWHGTPQQRLVCFLSGVRSELMIKDVQSAFDSGRKFLGI